MQTALWLGFAQWTVRCGFVSTTPLLAITRTTVVGWMLGASNNPARQAGTSLSLLTFMLIGSQHLNSWSSPPRRSTGPAFRRDQRNRRQTDKLQILSWNPAPARGSDPSTLPTHLSGPWRVVCVQRGCRRRHRQFPGGELLRDHPAPWRCSPQQGHFCARLHVHADPGPLLARVLFVGRRGHGCYWQVSAGRLTRRARTSRSPAFTSTNRSSAPALRSDQRNRRPTEKQQLLSWNPGPAGGLDPNTLASHLNGPWHVVCVKKRVQASSPTVL